MIVSFSKKAEAQLIQLNDYLLASWGAKSKDKFLTQFDGKIKQILSHPLSSPASAIMHGVHRCVVTKQCTFYYRLGENEVEIITIIDTRQNPLSIFDKS